MLKRTLQTPPETGTISGYTGELSRYLRNGVPGERADEIVQEAHAHLLDRADEIAAQNTDLTPAEAEAQAVASFTPAVTFARDMAQSAYETGHSKAWRTMGGFVALMLLVGVFAAFAISVWDEFRLVFTPLLILVLIPPCAFAARRAQTRRYLSWGTGAVVCTFFYTGLFYVDGAPGNAEWTQGSRTAITQAYVDLHTENLRYKNDVRLLKKGLRTYKAEPPVIPAELKGPNDVGYLVPNPYRREQGYGHPFQRNAPEFVATLAEARERWKTEGRWWLERIAQRELFNVHAEEPLRFASLQTGFARTATHYAAEMGTFAAFMVLCDWFFAGLGRAAFTKRRKSHKTKWA